MGGSVADPVTTILLSNGRFSRSGRGGSVPCPAFIFPSGGSFSESGRGGGGAGFFDDGGGGGGFFLVSGGGGAAGDVGHPPDTPPALLTSPPASSAPVEQQSPTQEEVKRGTGVREVEKEVWDDQLRRAQERARSIVGLKSRR